MVGLSPTLTFDLIESVWGARYLMRTPMDLQGVASRDIGISFKGPLSSGGRWSYRAMLCTGIEFGAESGDGRTTVQLFAGDKTDTRRWGVQYSYQDRQEDPRLELASAFFVQSLPNLDELRPQP